MCEVISVSDVSNSMNALSTARDNLGLVRGKRARDNLGAVNGRAETI